MTAVERGKEIPYPKKKTENLNSTKIKQLRFRNVCRFITDTIQLEQQQEFNNKNLKKKWLSFTLTPAHKSTTL